MGPIGSPFSKVGIEVTDSIYVVLNMDIMTRIGVKALRQLGDSNDFVRGQHAKADINEENRYIVQFPEENAIWSINSGYGGNVLLGKKCFALRIASYQGMKEGWMAEHMLILGLSLIHIWKNECADNAQGNIVFAHRLTQKFLADIPGNPQIAKFEKVQNFTHRCLSFLEP